MATSETRASVICDAGPLIHLDEVGCLDLLADFVQVLVPEAVWREVSHHRPDVLHNVAVQLVRVPTLALKDQGLKILAQALALDAGETAALALMQNHPATIFLTDDAAARVAAEQLGMQVHGTIGIILRAMRRQQRSPQEVLAILGNLPMTSTLHIRESLLKSIMERVKQEYGLD